MPSLLIVIHREAHVCKTYRRQIGICVYFKKAVCEDFLSLVPLLCYCFVSTPSNLCSDYRIQTFKQTSYDFDALLAYKICLLLFFGRIVYLFNRRVRRDGGDDVSRANLFPKGPDNQILRSNSLCSALVHAYVQSRTTHVLEIFEQTCTTDHRISLQELTNVECEEKNNHWN